MGGPVGRPLGRSRCAQCTGLYRQIYSSCKASQAHSWLREGSPRQEKNSEKVLRTVTLYGRSSRALTLQNLCQASPLILVRRISSQNTGAQNGYKNWFSVISSSMVLMARAPMAAHVICVCVCEREREREREYAYSAHMYIYVCMYACMHMYVCVCVCICMCVCVCVCMHMCVCVCMYVYTYICVCACIYM